MPIYEFYCPDCHTLFNFLSKSVSQTKRPLCPRCKKIKLKRQVSSFTMTGRARKENDMDNFPLDEGKMEHAITSMAGEIENMNEDDPRQAARFMRKFGGMTGMQFGTGMEEALSRMEAGENPEKIESEMADLLDNEDPFVFPDKKGAGTKKDRRKISAPYRDMTLYEM